MYMLRCEPFEVLVLCYQSNLTLVLVSVSRSYFSSLLTMHQNVTGFFTRAADTSIPLIYHVRSLMDGGMFCTRYIEVTQGEDAEKRICFTSTATFKRDEPDNINIQEKVDLREKYRAALGHKRPEDWPECPGIDAPW